MTFEIQVSSEDYKISNIKETVIADTQQQAIQILLTKYPQRKYIIHGIWQKTSIKHD